MSDRPPQSIKDLVERVPDGEARLALQALTREVERLKGEVAGRERALESVRKYLTKAFRMTFDDWCKAFEANAASPPGSVDGIVTLSTQEAEARGALAQAEAEKDYLEFCRKAFQILEADVVSFVEEARVATPTAVDAGWDLLQQRRIDRSEWSKQKAQKAGRDVSGWNDYERRELQDDVAQNSVSDLIEFTFIILYGDEYLKATRKRPTPSYDRYWTLIRVREVRNAASHGQMGDPNSWKRDTREFFEAAEYSAVRTALAKTEEDIAKLRAKWAGES